MTSDAAFSKKWYDILAFENLVVFGEDYNTGLKQMEISLHGRTITMKIPEDLEEGLKNVLDFFSRVISSELKK